MKKENIVKIKALALGLVTTLALGSLGNMAASLAKEMPASGQCGDSVSFTIDEDMTLTLAGTGAAAYIDLNEDESDDFYATDNAAKIKKIVVEEGITSLCYGQFRAMENVTEVSLPSTLTSIDEKAFRNMRRLKSITIPASVTEANNIFLNNDDLREVTNLSSIDINVKWKNTGLTWKVDGKKTTVIPAGKTGVATPNKYTITYKLRGGKLSGKKVKKYTYGMTPTKIPSAKKKGYVFAGWGTSKYDFGRYKGSISGLVGNVKLFAVYEKVSVAAKGKKISVTLTPFGSVKSTANLYVKIADNKKMDDATVYYYRSWDPDSTPENITYKAGKKSDVMTFKNLKKGKTYYVKVGYRYDPDGIFEDYFKPFYSKTVKL
ncbi:MAG TPA: hypothetical protein DCP06_06280 [Lachnospiraceae bacterium]|nr:hypothetical protein [Lachnospiraceae bacterium]